MMDMPFLASEVILDSVETLGPTVQMILVLVLFIVELHVAIWGWNQGIFLNYHRVVL